MTNRQDEGSSANIPGFSILPNSIIYTVDNTPQANPNEQAEEINHLKQNLSEAHTHLEIKDSQIAELKKSISNREQRRHDPVLGNVDQSSFSEVQNQRIQNIFELNYPLPYEKLDSLSPELKALVLFLTDENQTLRNENISLRGDRDVLRQENNELRDVNSKLQKENNVLRQNNLSLQRELQVQIENKRITSEGVCNRTHNGTNAVYKDCNDVLVNSDENQTQDEMPSSPVPVVGTSQDLNNRDNIDATQNVTGSSPTTLMNTPTDQIRSSSDHLLVCPYCASSHNRPSPTTVVCDFESRSPQQIKDSCNQCAMSMIQQHFDEERKKSIETRKKEKTTWKAPADCDSILFKEILKESQLTRDHFRTKRKLQFTDEDKNNCKRAKTVDQNDDACPTPLLHPEEQMEANKMKLREKQKNNKKTETELSKHYRLDIIEVLVKLCMVLEKSNIDKRKTIENLQRKIRNMPKKQNVQANSTRFSNEGKLVEEKGTCANIEENVTADETIHTVKDQESDVMRAKSQHEKSHLDKEPDWLYRTPDPHLTEDLKSVMERLAKDLELPHMIYDT